jgi:Cu/Ag efflux protein CusF
MDPLDRRAAANFLARVVMLTALAGLPRARAQAATAAGEVTKLDKAAGKITLKHSGIRNLDMPPMTMGFRVPDSKVLDDLAVGDRVRFVAERIDGQYVVVSLSKAP